MIDRETKKEVLVKLNQGESIESLAEMYGIAIPLLEEWRTTPPKLSMPDSIGNFFDPDKRYDSISEELDDKLEIAAVSLLNIMNEYGFLSPSNALLVKVNVESVAKLRMAFPRDSDSARRAQKSSTALQQFKNTLKD